MTEGREIQCAPVISAPLRAMPAKTLPAGGTAGARTLVCTSYHILKHSYSAFITVNARKGGMLPCRRGGAVGVAEARRPLPPRGQSRLYASVRLNSQPVAEQSKCRPAGEAVLSARLKLIGSCRNAGDAARVDALRRLAAELQIQDHVDFYINAPWDEVRRTVLGADT